MARIVYALSGQGRGHTSRGMAIAHGLRGRGHTVLFCGGGAARSILKTRGEQVMEVPQLQQVLRGNAVQPAPTIVANWPYIRNLSQIVSRLAEQLRDWRADLVITDFEAFSWRAANLIDVPVISLNHQQIVTETTYTLPARYQFNANLTRLIINIIAPRSPQRLLLSSFYFPPVKRADITSIVPPIIRPEVKCTSPSRGDYILVYYNEPEGNRELLDLLRADGRRYVLYNFTPPEETAQYSNLIFKPARLSGFLEDLAGCRGVMCTAGFTLISESLYLGKPVLAVPNRGIFEQTLNALFLEREGLGTSVIGRDVRPADLNAFNERCDDLTRKQPQRAVSGNIQALDVIEAELGSLSTSAAVNRPILSQSHANLGKLQARADGSTDRMIGGSTLQGVDDSLVAVEPSLFDKTRAFMAEGAALAQAKAAGLYPYFRAIESNEGTRAMIGGRSCIMAGSNNYLGLTTDPRVKEAAARAVNEYGTGCTGSRFLNGTLDIHLELEERLAAFMQKEACILFSTGYMTNMGVVQGATSKGDLIFSDKDNHSCIVAGTQVSAADTWRYRHFDMAHLRHLLEKANRERPEADKLIVTDGVFSMSGRIAPVPDLIKLAAEFDAALMVDDAHAVGVIGPRGRGSAAYFGLDGEVPITTGTFSKSFASIGGFAVGDRHVIEYIRHMAASHIFSASMPPSSVATVLKCLEILEDEPWRLERLWQISSFMRQGFRDAGFNVWTSEAPIIPVVIGGEMMTAFQFWTDLLEEGVFVNPVVPWRGAIAGNRCIMRTSYMATHSDGELEFILDAFKRVGHKHGVLGSDPV